MEFYAILISFFFLNLRLSVSLFQLISGTTDGPMDSIRFVHQIKYFTDDFRGILYVNILFLIFLAFCSRCIIKSILWIYSNLLILGRLLLVDSWRYAKLHMNTFCSNSTSRRYPRCCRKARITIARLIMKLVLTISKVYPIFSSK